MSEQEQIKELQEKVKNLQLQLRAQQKLASLGMLVAGIAHEIQNPLNFVINFSKLSGKLLEEMNEILEDNEESLSQEDQEDMEEVLEDTEDQEWEVQEDMEEVLEDMEDQEDIEDIKRRKNSISFLYKIQEIDLKI